jgi:amidophosphoribosyltransferase
MLGSNRQNSAYSTSLQINSELALVDDLLWCVQQGNANITEFDCSCFNGKYVTGDIDKNYLQDIEDLRSDDAKQQNDTNASSELICNDVE